MFPMESEMYLPLARKMLATEHVSWTDTACVSMFYVGAAIKLQTISVARFATGFILSLWAVPVLAVKLYERNLLLTPLTTQALCLGALYGSYRGLRNAWQFQLLALSYLRIALSPRLAAISSYAFHQTRRPTIVWNAFLAVQESVLWAVRWDSHRTIRWQLRHADLTVPTVGLAFPLLIPFFPSLVIPRSIESVVALNP